MISSILFAKRCWCLSLAALLLAWRMPRGNAFVAPQTPFGSSPLIALPKPFASPLVGRVRFDTNVKPIAPPGSGSRHGLVPRTTVTRGSSRTALHSILRNIIEAVETIPEDFDLGFGMFVIFCAVTPYFLGLFFPRFLFKEFFIPVYGADKEDDGPGRRAEIYWKLMYATQGLVLTSITFSEAILDYGITQALRDSYVAWAIFYVAAIIKIRYEATVLEIIEESRVGIQLWHSFVAISLLVDVGLRPDVLEVVKKSVQ